jgi:hypothetical protein
MPTLLPLELIKSFAWWRILAYVVSAVCLGTMVTFTIPLETTPDVYQASGYGDIAANKSIWFVSRFDFDVPFSYFNKRSVCRFWFFAARKNPDTAPLIAWFNGDVSGAR